MDKKIIAWSFMLCAIGIYLVIEIGKKDKKPTFAIRYLTTNENGIIITRPDNDAKSYNVVIVFGGMAYATPEWMKKQVPNSALLNNIFVFADYTKKFSSVTSAIDSFLSKNSLTQESRSIIGFSAGAYNVLDNYNKKYKIVGLIDPSNKDYHSTQTYSPNTIMFYNEANWSAYPSIKRNMPILARKIKSDLGRAKKLTMAHKEIPKYFFEEIFAN